MRGHRYLEEISLAAMLAGVAPEVYLRECVTPRPQPNPEEHHQKSITVASQKDLFPPFLKKNPMKRKKLINYGGGSRVIQLNHDT